MKRDYERIPAIIERLRDAQRMCEHGRDKAPREDLMYPQRLAVLKRQRLAAMREARAAGLTLREIGAEVGGVSAARVKQLLEAESATLMQDGLVAVYGVDKTEDDEGPLLVASPTLWASWAESQEEAFAVVDPELIDNLLNAMKELTEAMRPDLAFEADPALTEKYPDGPPAIAE